MFVNITPRAQLSSGAGHSVKNISGVDTSFLFYLNF